MKSLLEWLIGCWSTCDECSWFRLLVNVISCLLRTIIIISLVYVFAQVGGDALREMAYPGS